MVTGNPKIIKSTVVHIAKGPFTFDEAGHRGNTRGNTQCGVYFALIMVPAATNKEVMFMNPSTNYKISI